MCGRYAITLPPEAMASLFGSDDRPNLAPRWNVAPTQAVPIVAVGKEGRRRIIQARWGLRPGWMEKDPPTGPLFNARSETVAGKPAFRAAFARQRCLIPADGFYEWKKEGRTRTPHFIRRAAGGPIAFAGLWEQAPQPGGAPPMISCTILTCAAAADFHALHDRFPVILDPPDWDRWLDRSVAPASLLPLLVPPPQGVMTAYEVSARVGSVANDDADLVLPVADRLI
jgi:putative SOS response-associated peptidase YedK